MATGDLRLRVTLASAPALVALGAGAFFIAGPQAALGVAAGAGLGLGHFWWLAGSAAGAMVDGGRSMMAWRAGAAIRLLTVWVALVGLLATGFLPPVAVVVGLVVVPIGVVGGGLRDAAKGHEIA